jgi:DNA-binding winged helix-turn-helix (wHTH) protein
MASLRFGEYTLDAQAHVLRRGGREVSLSKKAFLLLETLLEKRPQLLSHQALRDRIWPTTFVSHTSLAGLVSDIRKVLGDDRHHPRYLRTVHGVGYAFVGEVLGESAPAIDLSRFLLRWRGREFPLVEGANLIGRSPDCEVRIASTCVSRQHSRIVVAADGATIEDLGSKNGTHVSGRRVSEPTPLRDGEEILLGQEALWFVAASAASSTETTETDQVSAIRSIERRRR